MSNSSRSSGQLVWGIALALMGVATFFRVPQVVPGLAEKVNFAAGQGFISFCLYLVGIILLGGGIKKIYAHYNPMEDDEPEQDDTQP